MPLFVKLLLSRGGLIGMGVLLVALAIGIQTARLKHAKHDLAYLKAADAAALLQAQTHAKAVESASAQVSASLRAQLEDSQGRIQTRTRTLIQKVPLYVTAKDDADCRVPDGAVRLHDAAALGLPDVAGGSGQHEQAPRVALSDLTRTVVANYGIAYDWRAEALTWRDWYAAQAKARK